MIATPRSPALAVAALLLACCAAPARAQDAPAPADRVEETPRSDSDRDAEKMRSSREEEERASEGGGGGEGRRHRDGTHEVGGAIGIAGGTVQDTAFAMEGRYEYWLTGHISLGPMVQLEVDDRLFQIGPTLNVRGVLPVSSVPRLRPSAQVGLGFLYCNIDRHHDPRDDDDFSFLLPIGVGLGYEVTDHVVVGTDFLLNITDVFGDNLYWTWFFGASYHF